jgi:hypothetical protein
VDVGGDKENIVIAVVARRDFSLDSFFFIPYSRLMLFRYLILSLEITLIPFIPPLSHQKKTRHTMIGFLDARIQEDQSTAQEKTPTSPYSRRSTISHTPPSYTPHTLSLVCRPVTPR